MLLFQLHDESKPATCFFLIFPYETTWGWPPLVGEFVEKNKDELLCGGGGGGKQKTTTRRCHSSWAATCVCPGVFTWITCGGSLEITTWVCLINREPDVWMGLRGSQSKPTSKSTCFLLHLQPLMPRGILSRLSPYIAMPGSGCFTEKPRTKVQPSGQLVHNCRVQQNSPPNWAALSCSKGFLGQPLPKKKRSESRGWACSPLGCTPRPAVQGSAREQEPPRASQR